MTASDQVVDSRKIDGLIVRAHNDSKKICLPTTYTREIMPANRSHIPTPEVAHQWPHLRRVADKLMTINDAEIGLLIGYNCPRALVPRDVIPPNGDEPYGQKTDLGWGIVGITEQINIDSVHDSIGVSHRILTCEIPESLRDVSSNHSSVTIHSFRTVIKESIDPATVVKLLESDFIEQKHDDVPYSWQYRLFLHKMTDGIHHGSDKHYRMPLPFKEDMPKLPNNWNQARHRLGKLKERFQRDTKYKDQYVEFMKNIIKDGYAEQVLESELYTDDGHCWYIPHHGVFHPKKPDKLRVLFDCSAKFNGDSLNNHLLQGPDLTNSLIAILCRFRQEAVAFVCDIQQMFFQFQVNVEHRNYLRFLWWDNDECIGNPIVFRMTVHLFGAASSPPCANFGLRKTADDHESMYGSDAANFIRRNFYVDDGLKSVPSAQEAIKLINDTKNICREGCIRLHKFVSNSKEVLRAIPHEDKAADIKDLDLLHDELPVERVLGIQRCIEIDAFQFRIVMDDKPLTRRGVLSTVSSIYDPLGFVAPLVLIGKLILQAMCAHQKDWDSPLPDEYRPKWEDWRNSLFLLETIELHHFSDASTFRYGQCSYLRLIYDQQRVHCSFVMGKARVAPLKTLTIPRLELTAALLSTRISRFVRKELEYKNVEEFFWTDSKVVLAYIANKARRFHVFVANRVQQIREVRQPSQWRYIPSELSPADDSPRGVRAEEFVSSSKWLKGPDFLWNQGTPEVCNNSYSSNALSPEDPEVRKVTVAATRVDYVSPGFELSRLSYFSSWYHLKRAVAACLRLKTHLMTRTLKLTPKDTRSCFADAIKTDRPVQVEDLQKGEAEIIRQVQAEAFKEEINFFTSINKIKMDETSRETDKCHNKLLRSKSRLYRLDPFLDEGGLIKVGGRLRHGDMLYSVKHPVVLPRNHHVTTLIIRHYHENTRHQGRGMTTNELRANGFWIIGCSGAVSQFISKCIECRKLRHSVQQQKMADLPKDRLETSPPFTYCGVDLFGPWYIRELLKQVKRYGVLFTCLMSREIHIETANSLETDSFINALRRFLSIRGPIRQLRSDRRTNFVGAERELRKAANEMNQSRTSDFLLQEGCYSFVFEMNVPSASHIGGVWERQIKTVRSVLAALLHHEGSQLDDESLRTLMCEVTAIVNSRPLTTNNLNDPTSLEPLTPNHLLTMKSMILLPPPGEFQRADIYSRKRWRRVQHLSNEFWSRWRKEYLHTLQPRRKWNTSHRDVQIGDIVLIKANDVPRNQWRLACVLKTMAGLDNHVRRVQLEVANGNFDSKGRRTSSPTVIERPIHKLVLIIENDP